MSTVHDLHSDLTEEERKDIKKILGLNKYVNYNEAKEIVLRKTKQKRFTHTP